MNDFELRKLFVGMRSKSDLIEHVKLSTYS